MTRQTVSNQKWKPSEEQIMRASARVEGLRDPIYGLVWDGSFRKKISEEEDTQINAYFQEAYNKSIRIEQILDEVDALRCRLDGLKFGDPDMAEIDRIEKRLQALATEEVELLAFCSGQSSDKVQECRGLEAFQAMKNLTADEVSISFIALDRLEISARSAKRRIVHCAEIGLLNRRTDSDDDAKLNRAGKLLYALAHKTLPQGKTRDAQAAAIKDLRKALSKLGVVGDLFKPEEGSWKPLFTLNDETKRADVRARARAMRPGVHISLDESPQYDPEEDETQEWIDRQEPD